jgi:hypothetical protein
MRVYFGSGERLDLSTTCNVLDEKFKDKTLRLMEVLKNRDQSHLMFLCGNFVKPPEKKYYPLSKKVLRLAEILKHACLGCDDTPLEITNYDANFTNPFISVKTNLFVVDEQDNTILDLLHLSLMLNYCPVYSSLEFMKERKLIFRIGDQYLMLFVINGEIFSKRECVENLETTCSDYARQEMNGKHKMKIGLIVNGTVDIGPGNVELRKHTAFDFVIMSDANFADMNEFEFFKQNKGFIGKSFEKYMILNLHFKSKIQIWRHFIMDYTSTEIFFRMVFEKRREEVREILVPEKCTLTDEYVTEKLRELLITVPKDQKIKVKFFYDYSNTFDIRNQDGLEKSIRTRVINPTRLFYLKKLEERRPMKLEICSSLRIDENTLDVNGDEVVTNLASRFQTEKRYKNLAVDTQRKEEIVRQNIENHKKIKKAYAKRTLAKAKNYIDSIKCPLN